MTENDDVLECVRRVYSRKFDAWRIERAKLDQMVAEADAAKRVIMVPNYWQAEVRAREQLRTAEMVLEALQS